MFIIYDILFFLFALLYVPFLIIRGKWHSGFKFRFGLIPQSFIKSMEGKKCIWIHAVSVGEVLVVTDLITKIKSAYPRYKIICSTVTKTGHQIAQANLSAHCHVIYAPVDFSWVVRRFIAIIKPVIYIAAETEIWPNLYMALKKQGTPIIQINGRISDDAFKGYKRVRFFMKRILSCVDQFYMQSALDAERVKKLGAPADRVHVTGNLKFDYLPETINIRKEDLGFDKHENLLIAGSTHPGEEDILIDAYTTLTKEFSDLRLVIAPRHIERVEELSKLITQKGYQATRLSRAQTVPNNAKAIVLVDTMGQLRKLYSLATIVFIGKSLTVGGGQNVIESAYYGKPTIVGPLTQNFKDIVSIFLKSEGLIQVNNAQELLAAMRELLANAKQAGAIGASAKRIIQQYQGATSKTVQAINGMLAESQS